MPDTTNAKLIAQLAALQKVTPEICVPGAHVLRDAAWQNWKMTDPDSLPEDVTYYGIEQGAEVSAQEENFDMGAVMEFDLAPFLRPAIDENQDAIIDAVKEAAQKQMQDLIRGA